MGQPPAQDGPAVQGRDKAGMTVPRFLALVAVATVALFALAIAVRPSFGARVAEAAGLRQVKVATPGSFYAARVAPVMEAHCTSCHGVNRDKGKLRLDSFAHLSHGGRGGPVVEAGNIPASELWTRVTLAPDDPKAMPPKGKQPLSRDELAVLRLWIEHGASPDLAAGAIRNAPPPPKVVRFDNVDPVRVAQDRAPLAKAVEVLQQRFPGVIAYAARGSADIHVNAALMGKRFGDAELAALAPLAGRIVEFDGSRTAITDASALRFMAMAQLRRVRLNDTAVGPETAKALASIRSIQSVAVTGTGIAADDFRPQAGRGVKLYASIP